MAQGISVSLFFSRTTVPGLNPERVNHNLQPENMHSNMSYSWTQASQDNSGQNEGYEQAGHRLDTAGIGTSILYYVIPR